MGFKSARQRMAVMAKLKSFNVDVGKSLKLVSYVMRVEAKSKNDAIKKVGKIGFNAGPRLSSTFKGTFKVRKKDIILIKNNVKLKK